MVTAKGPETRDKLKRVALRLFADRGVDNVPVRDILAAAKQKNGGSLHYYFGGKDGLIRELLLDGAQRIDAIRLERLEEIEKAGGPHSLQEIVALLAEPFHAVSTSNSDDYLYISMMNTLINRDYSMFLRSIEGHDLGYRKCIDYIRERITQIPQTIFSQRVVLMNIYLFAVVSARATANRMDGNNLLSNFRFSEQTFIDTIIGMLNAPVTGGDPSRA